MLVSTGESVRTKKLVISAYLQYTFLVFGALLLFVFVGEVQVLVQNPEGLIDRVTRLLNWAHELLYAGKQVAAINQAPLEQFVQSATSSAGQAFSAALGLTGGTFGVIGAILNLMLMLITPIYLLLDRERITDAALRTVSATSRGQPIEPFLTLAMSALYGVVDAVFAVPNIATDYHYLYETLLFQGWPKAPVTEIVFERGACREHGLSRRESEPAKLCRERDRLWV